MPRTSQRVICVFVLAAVGATSLGQSRQEPSIQDLVERGKQTISRLQRDPVAWSATFELPTGNATIQINTKTAGANSRITAAIVQDGSSRIFCFLYIRDGVWYVVQDDDISKYRPYEAPFMLPSLYLLLAKSDRIVVTEQTFASARFESIKENIATFRAPLPDNARRQLQLSINAYEQAKKQDSSSIDQTLAQMMPQVRESLERGMTIDVDVDTGVIVASGAPGYRYWIKNLEWLPPETSLGLPHELTAATDRSTSLFDFAGTRDDLVMFGYAGGWAPGQPAIDTDAVILNTRSGEVRRVPYPMGGTLPGCFSKDRGSVFISGLVLEEGTTGLFQVDLETSETRRIAADTLVGMTMFPTVSGDGRYLACINKSGSESEILDSQVCRVEIATGRVDKIGKPMDTAFLSWLPDNSGLLLVTRKRGEPKMPVEDTVARMDLLGQITPIRPGSFPVLLVARQRILFLDQTDKSWKLCNYSGQQVERFGDGLPGFNFPALSPDGKRLIMMRFARSTGPRPYYIDLSTGTHSPVIAGNGLWVMPSWR